MVGIIKGDARSLDYSSLGFEGPIDFAKKKACMALCTLYYGNLG